MTSFTNIWRIAAKIAELANDATILAALERLRLWFASLSPAEKLAYASKFDSYGGYGVSCCPDGCPNCPDDCIPAESALLAAAAPTDVNPFE